MNVLVIVLLQPPVSTEINDQHETYMFHLMNSSIFPVSLVIVVCSILELLCLCKMDHLHCTLKYVF